MDKRPFILISNDDGIDSPGLHATVEAMLPLGDVLITAPMEQQTAMGRAYRGNKDAVFEKRMIPVYGKEVEAWCLDASPATTVRHALQCLCKSRKPDLLVSGINYGENLGTNITASGTVGAALEASESDIKSIAVSLEMPKELQYNYGEVDWTPAISILRKAASKLLKVSWPYDVDIIKIDIPEGADDNTPWMVCRQSREPGWWGLVPDASPEAKLGTTVGRKAPRPGYSLKEEDDATVLIKHRAVAITPLSIELTSRVAFSEVEKLIS